jgi:ABC-type multidrug transport system permease subunit
MNLARQSWVLLTSRYLRQLYRQPAIIGITLTQPIIWLLLFGALFKKVTEIPGFGGGNYITYLTPGVVIMTALFSSSWTGMAFIEDMDSGVMDRFLTAPIARSALITATSATRRSPRSFSRRSSCCSAGPSGRASPAAPRASRRSSRSRY